ncbi:putative RNA-directed DNA polymerase (reverse transcriptase), Non LTR Retrotransposon protein, partial [Trachipleistophora hominis]
VPHERLFAKLQSYGICGKFLNPIKAIYRRPMGSVKTGDKCPKPFYYKTDVKQRCLAPPILFDLYINDQFDVLTGIKVEPKTSVPGLLFADDTGLFAEDYDKTKICIPRIKQECEKRKMELNITEFGVMRFDTEATATIKYKIIEISQVSSYRCLRLPIDRKLNMNTITNDRKDRKLRAFRMIQAFLQELVIPWPI